MNEEIVLKEKSDATEFSIGREACKHLVLKVMARNSSDLEEPVDNL